MNPSASMPVSQPSGSCHLPLRKRSVAIWRQQVRSDLPGYHRIQLVGFLIGPLPPFGQLGRRHIQPTFSDSQRDPHGQAP